METTYKNFNESTVPKLYSVQLAENSGDMVNIPEEYVHFVVETIIMAMSDYAKIVKTKERPIAIVINDFKHNMLLALKVSFQKGTKENPEGSWQPEWTFDPSDLEGCTLYSVDEDKAMSFFTKRGLMYRMTFNDPTFIYTACLTFAGSLISWLDMNAKENEKVGIDHPGFFKAAVTIIDGVKVMTFSADEEMTNLVKDDAKLQTAN